MLKNGYPIMIDTNQLAEAVLPMNGGLSLLDQDYKFITHYDERMDCSARCCCGCNDDQVDSKVAGGSVF